MDPAVRALRPSARRILFAYLGSLAVFLTIVVVPTLPLLPRTIAANWHAIVPHLEELQAAAGRWDTVMVLVWAVAVILLALPTIGLVLTVLLLGRRLIHKATTRRPAAPTNQGFDPSGFTIVRGTAIPGAGEVDYFGFGFDGELALFGTDLEQARPEVEARLRAAAVVLGSFSADMLDRLLLDGPPYAEVVARAARRSGRSWDEVGFRKGLDDTLSQRNFELIVLTSHGRRSRRTRSGQNVTKMRNRRE